MPSRNNRKRHRNAEETMQLLETFVHNGGRTVFRQFVKAVDPFPYDNAPVLMSDYEIKDIRKDLKGQLGVHMGSTPEAIDKAEKAATFIEGSLKSNNKVAAQKANMMRQWSKMKIVS